jgi:hypothetical protein
MRKLAKMPVLSESCVSCLWCERDLVPATSASYLSAENIRQGHIRRYL